MPNLIESIKKAALDAVENSKPCAVMFGKVTSVSPMKINVEQKMTLTSAQLILTSNVTGQNSLIVGDTVVLLRMQGGQKYVVWDRVIT